ncbi:hypothetical protein MMC18_000880 [Xylographa bjoerkii]|nr:hypothetical protein [Xylographa bjoerkii]
MPAPPFNANSNMPQANHSHPPLRMPAILKKRPFSNSSKLQAMESPDLGQYKEIKDTREHSQRQK